MTWILAISLIYIEFWYFFNPDHTFKFVPDKEFSGYVDINVDLTVAMPCESEKHICIYIKIYLRIILEIVGNKTLICIYDFIFQQLVQTF